MRAVRQNTLLIAGGIPESKCAFRATPETRSVAETPVHIAWLWTADRFIQEERRLDSPSHGIGVAPDNKTLWVTSIAALPESTSPAADTTTAVSRTS